MNGLYPIIRRVRRPLLPVEAAAEAKPAVVQAAPAPEPTAAVESAPRKDTQPKRKDKRGKVAASEPAK